MIRLYSITAAIAVVLATPVALHAQRPTTLAGRSTVYAPHAAVATSQPLASAAGLEVLRKGGNAVDAAVAAAAVLAVTEPHMTGIGGDMFAIVWLAKEQKLVALNASGRAGSLMTRETLQARGFRPGSQQGVMSVTVPGALAGWDKLLRTYGRRTLAQVLERSGLMAVQVKQAEGLIEALRAQCLIGTTLHDAIQAQRSPADGDDEESVATL